MGDGRADPGPWIVGPAYDLAWIFGGAAVSLAVPVLVAWEPSLLPVIFWIWLVGVDGSHQWATLTRTYLDREYWREHRALLLGSLAWYLVPVLVVAAYLATGAQDVMDVFLFLAQAWAYYHVVRQHYGYVSIYDRKSGAAAGTHAVNKWALYLGLAAPYFYFMISHPFNRALGRLGPLHTADPVQQLVVVAAPCISLAAAVGLLGFHGLRRGQGGAGASLGAAFTATCLVVYSVTFYGVAPREPFLPGARTWIQAFMATSVMMSVFHGIQYQGIVWHLNGRRYHRPEARETYGPAALVSAGPLVYALSAVPFVALYGYAAWCTTEYPSISGALLAERFVPVAVALWWGVSFHHFYLDQKIWRISRSPELRRQLEVAT